MNTSEIELLVKGSGTSVLACDQLPTKKVTNNIYIVNTDEISKEGTHWIVLAKLGSTLIFADSLGLPPLLCSFCKFINLNMNDGDTLKINRFPFQAETSKTCGMYSVLMAWHLHRGLAFEQFCQRYSSACPESNDILLQNDWSQFLDWHKKKKH